MSLRIGIVSVLLLAGALYLGSATKSEDMPIRRSLAEFPGRIGHWNEERSSEFDQKTLQVLGVNDYINRVYFNSEENRVDLYIGYYVSQRQGDTIHSPLNCLPGSGWNPVKSNISTIFTKPESNSYSSLQPGNIQIKKIVIQKGLDKRVVLYWYQSHGRVIASEYWGKIYTVIDAIRLNRTDAALVRVICPVNGMEEIAETNAERDAVDFVKVLYPLLHQYLPD